VIGANFDDNEGGSDAGSAYVFIRSNGAWTQRAKLLAGDGSAADWFGYGIAISGDTALVGAYSDDHVGGIDAGSAYVFDLNCDNDGDGVTNDIDECPDNKPGLAVDCHGRPKLDMNNDCNVDGLDTQLIVQELLKN
jgi:hypothetical protein